MRTFKSMLLGGVAGSAGLAVLALGAPALADVNVFATIDKQKDVFVTEFITVFNTVFLDVSVVSDPDKFAESDALINQTNFFNFACTNCDEKTDSIQNSGNNNSGVLTINQAAGNMNNQGTAIALAVDVEVDPGPVDPPDADTGFAEAQAGAEQVNADNVVKTQNILFRNAFINNSLNANTGVVAVNQSAGNMGNQANSIAIALSFADEGVALSEADLGQFNVSNIVLEGRGPNSPVGVNKRAEITNSINTNSGVVGVNQSVGNMGNQANIVSFAVVSAL
jgi:hypothetical protein